MDEEDQSVDFFLGFKSAGVLLWKPSFFLAFQGIFRLCNRFFMQFFVIIKVTEKLEKKGKGHAIVFVGFDLDQVSEDEV